MKRTHLPEWLHRGLAPAGSDIKTRSTIRHNSIGTICEAALCPNRGECFCHNTATFLLLGPHCTRNCAFCAVTHGTPLPPDPTEPERIAEAAEALGLRYIVLTSVTRDDLPDGGAEHFASAITRLNEAGYTVEALIPDFGGDMAAVDVVANAGPAVLAHDIQTVPRLYPAMRPAADYQRSIGLLAHVTAHYPSILTKAAILVGLGETEPEIQATLGDLASAGVRIAIIGQYIQPTCRHTEVARWWTPAEMDEMVLWGAEFGILVYAAPLARSSYKAQELYLTASSTTPSWR
jgi:lipoic acid synthetase